MALPEQRQKCPKSMPNCKGMEEAILFLDRSLSSGSCKVGVKEEMYLTSKWKHSFAVHHLTHIVSLSEELDFTVLCPEKYLRM